MKEEKDEIFPRPLKRVEPKQIEEAIAKALSELTGEEYEAEILNLNFNPDSVLNAQFRDAVEIKVQLMQPFKSELFSSDSK
ncbi:MAG: hypothetical protein A3I04_00500 [Nitrospinae bacterium RIFCSPLOWO2_02_FULL_39_110]|nr:MAG: hypothetical protein A2W53_06020 [Nitrospinae bacterium RIFCSPHIGHO2_02_39_11]OGW00698.1 MAG: hypothetical protein A3D97_08160 [Nitrospinae bacterium RIFCSPHIGHO2_12_FULL_39_42]OGW01716.1 MAG: hypothetical protein A3D20_07940 [Nitrospinae bacterium RIFCSPHIGHO2_02_FULL_39_82]OGW04441.1 MAG: hypothetical protein A2Z59_05175 [Nitrospinae bacterium RIFCSPLOWO2_02_39_17]OGW06419.1 MAG: hypothetical protein A3I04_00500 [Nitrospinae bacterium RIFCSPLOWO2_02_FULL_39_110]OGW08159.1 MAG: hypoth